MEKNIFSVSEINEYIKGILDADVLLGGLFIRGELSNYKIYPSGHHYFSLKDAEGAIRCVMFRGSTSRLRFKPENGMKVVVYGRITVFPRDGAYQLYVSEITPDGVGDLHVAFEQLKMKLMGEGLFNNEHKKPIPKFPKNIAVITSGAGAAVRDIIRVLGKRYPLAKVIIMPVRVQGTEAPPEIVGAIKYANRFKIADVIITGRGGGSIEDLWAFNDERVARAIFESVIPVISAVGHEPDVTISDFVADLRAATPSNAAELCVPDLNELKEKLESAEIRVLKSVNVKVETLRTRLDELSSRRVMQSPINYIEDKRMLLDHAQQALISAVYKCVKDNKEQYIRLSAMLDAMSPLKVLSRGYSIALNDSGKIIKKAKDIKSGEKVIIRFARDELSCTVD